MVRGAITLAFVCASVGLVVLGSSTHSLTDLRVEPNFSTSASEVAKLLVARVRTALATGSGSNVARHVGYVKDGLRSTYRALPKNVHGRIDASYFNYALRRHFTSTRGWHITILDGTVTAGESIEGERPAYLDVMQELVKERRGQHGFDLDAVAVIGTIIEHLVIEDTLSTLQLAYEAKQHATETTLSTKQAAEVLALHLASYISGRNISGWKPAQAAKFEKTVHRTYPNWGQVKKRLLDEQIRLFPSRQYMTYAEVEKVAEEVSVRFAQWQNGDCSNTRLYLQELEAGVHGRVRLGDFYDAALNMGKYQFTETIDYLREAGALDESDELDPQVIVPNYVNGHSNCVARTNSYSVCCLDMCERIFADLEQQLGKPVASPDEIVAAVEATGRLQDSADLFDRSSVLRRRLAEVSTALGGVVVIHGRLFAQWLHVAFPRDCAFPHKSNTVYTKTVEQWERETKKRSVASAEELQNWVQLARDVRSSASDRRVEAAGSVGASRRSEGALWGMWNMEEELVSVHKRDDSTRVSEAQRKRAGAWNLSPGLVAHAVPVTALAGLVLLGALWKASLWGVMSKKHTSGDFAFEDGSVFSDGVVLATAVAVDAAAEPAKLETAGIAPLA
eukprot:TRINITY_DN5801_c0_g1_i1.p1 TRINITY_DN5801_c0_g1~~TRINITY_DN5801_c0_g1_i1.p1  ORF type:complete len:631 (-),score=107.27 TRINITY_DN5801_c0_g1_i1:499-2358(-)